VERRLRLLILGGSYNPVHIGHLILAEELACQYGYDRVLLVPALEPPHKALTEDPGAPLRLAMLRASVEGDPLFIVDDCELTRQGPSYTVDTIRHAIAAYAPQGRPALAIGDDLVSGFSSWREPEAILALADVIVARRGGESRPGESRPGERKGLDGREASPFPHLRAANSLIPISSSLVRERIKSGGAWRRLVPDAAARIIGERRLYGLAACD
jgi:nicotinate-nucleotide adenylyltransferase